MAEDSLTRREFVRETAASAAALAAGVSVSGIVPKSCTRDANFGMVVAVNDISLSIEEGEVIGIVGTNGSGKTTFLNIVTGYLQPSHGTVRFQDFDITGLSPERITARGIGRSFQIPQLFRSINLLELQNGVTDELGSLVLPTGAITAVRVVIDTDSSSMTLKDGRVVCYGGENVIRE